MQMFRDRFAGRPYVVVVPSTRGTSAGSVERLPLVVALHGQYGTADQFLDQTQLHQWVDAARCVLLLPSTADPREGWLATPDDGSDLDVNYLLALLGRIVNRHRCDPARIYGTGFSRGARMIYRLACRTKLLAAVAGVGATQSVDWETPDGWQPPRMLHLHGLADPISDPHGERRMPDGTLPWSLQAHGAWWDMQGGTWLVGTLADRSDPQHPVDAGHDWCGPGTKPRALGLDLGPQLTQPDVSRCVLQWFGLLPTDPTFLGVTSS